jgi:hypothetical protein
MTSVNTKPDSSQPLSATAARPVCRVVELLVSGNEVALEWFV